jgi:phenylalanyl-tRNA synthetase beta chain
MKVSLNWIREYLDFELPAIDELAAKIGSQIGGIDEVIDIGRKYRGIVIVRVDSVAKLEDSDHLNVCLIDDGHVVENINRESSGLVQVVCGAPNVHEGMFVAWLPPGSVVPNSFNDSEPFVLSARPLRGVVSNGMLASAQELGIGENHEGLLELDGEHQPGTDFAATYGLNDVIIDIENKMFTHRPDCFGQLGIAREVAGVLGHQFVSPSWYTNADGLPDKSDADTMHIDLTNEIPESVPRYMLVTMDGIAVAPSPVWLQTYLTRLGVRPINNIVDVTNYVMLLTGQPLHAFDYDKVAVDERATIVVRNPHVDETITLLDGKTIRPRPAAIMICDQEKPIGLGGMMGGQNSEIDSGTKRIIIECASFDMYNIRRTSMEHGIFSEAVTRFTKGQSEWQCPAVLSQAIQLIQQVCAGAKTVGNVIDNHQPKRDFQPVPVKSSFINERLGLKLGDDVMQELLQHVEFGVKLVDDGLLVDAPFWRTDIELREDIVEEVGRLHGFENLPATLPRRDITPTSRNPMFVLKARIRNSMTRAGANELLTYSFVHGNVLDKATQDKTKAFRVSNALSPDLQYYRLSLMPSLLEKVHANIKSGYDSFVLYEIGKGHNTDHLDPQTELPVEFEMMEAVYAAQDKVAPAGAAYYQARNYLVNLLADLGIEPTFSQMPTGLNFATVQPFEPGRSAIVSLKGSDIVLGGVGEFKASVRKSFKLPAYAAGFNLSLTDLLQAVSSVQQSGYQPLSRFPKVAQDITLRVESDVTYQQLFDVVLFTLTEAAGEQVTLSLHPLDIYQSEHDSDYKHVSLRLSIASYKRTLTDDEVSKLLDDASAAAAAAMHAERI